MKYYLIKFHDNWADEMDIDGFAIISEKLWDLVVKITAIVKNEPYSLGFGTNQCIDYRSIADLMTRFEVCEPLDSDIKVIKSLFPGRFGHFPLNQLLECLFEDFPELEEFSEDWIWGEL